MSYKKEELERIVCACLEKLRKQDKFLLDININERTLTHKLAEYLQQNFSEFDVDCEYNRLEKSKKELELPSDRINWNDTEAKTVFPDIIIHKRGTQEKNILIIEVKKSNSSTDGAFDQNKLMSFTIEPINYEFGLFLKIDMAASDDKLVWYSNGIKISNEEICLD